MSSLILRDNWNTELIEAKTSINLVGRLPHEIVYEIQNALMHLIIGVKSSSAKREEEFKQAISHIKRANLDVLKIRLFEIYKKLEAERQAGGCKRPTEFQKRFAQARITELQSLSGDHREAIATFRKIISDFFGVPVAPSLAYPLPSSAQAQTDKNYQILDKESCDLLWQWGQLEILNTSLSGERVYDVSANMVNAFLSWENFAEYLSNYIATLRVNIILLLITKDCDNSFHDVLRNSPEGEKILKLIPYLKSANSQDEAESQRAVREVEPLAKAIFPQVMDFLGIKLLDTLNIA